MSDNKSPTAGIDMDAFVAGLWRENPVLVQVLGTCPTMAVSNSGINALSMGLATTFVLVMSSTLVSLFRKVIPKEVRIGTFILIIATFVTIVDYLIQAISLEIHKALGAFIALIVVNCIILGRAEAYASKNSIGKSALDGLGNGIGFTLVLLCLGIPREILGSGTIFGLHLFAPDFQTWSIMLLPGGGFFALASWLMVFTVLKARKRQAAAQ